MKEYPSGLAMHRHYWRRNILRRYTTAVDKRMPWLTKQEEKFWQSRNCFIIVLSKK
jgi:hypothetical protein